MRGTYRVSVVASVLLLAGLSGCAATNQARYVYQDGQYGVVGIPENTSTWPTFYHDQAEALMAKHFPDGYEIVRAEEVVEGSRTLTVNGTNAAKVEAATVVPFLKLGTLGRTASHSQADNVKITECRILYRKKGCETVPEPGFADRATLSPEPYIDPNADARHHVVARPPAKSDEPNTAKLAKEADDAAAKAIGATDPDAPQATKATARKQRGE